MKSCKKTLRDIGPHIGANEINEIFKKHLVDDTNLHYGEFMSNLSKIMVWNELPYQLQPTHLQKKHFLLRLPLFQRRSIFMWWVVCLSIKASGLYCGVMLQCLQVKHVLFYLEVQIKLTWNCFPGFLMSNLAEEHRETINKEHACRGANVVLY